MLIYDCAKREAHRRKPYRVKFPETLNYFFERKTITMKKLFALVLSIALVVAIAVPAMASGWNRLSSDPTYLNVDLAIYGLELKPNTTKLGSIYAPLTATYPVAQGSDVHFVVEVALPDWSDLSPATQGMITANKLELEIAASNIDLDEKFNSYKNTTKTEETLTASELKNDAVAYSYEQAAFDDSVYSYEFTGEVKASNKDAKVVATLGCYQGFKTVGSDDVMEIDADQDGKIEYVVTADGNNFKVANADGDFVNFPVKGEKVDASKAITISNGTEYAITKSVTTNPAFALGTDITNSGSLYNELKAIYADIFGFLGFDYDEANYMTKDHFEKYFGTLAEKTVTLVYPSGAVVSAPATPDLPQTGDNASIVGFAMIVVAMVAAAVVTVKKVRA